MKLERLQEYVTTIVAITVGVVLAYYFGTQSGSGHFGKIVVVMGLIAFSTLLLAMRENIWVLIPMSWLFAAKVEDIPGHPALKDVVVLLVFAGVFALSAFKIIRRKPKFDAVSFWVIIVLAYLVTVYIRNPVGGEALGSVKVGGRPYLNVATAALAYYVLARVALPIHFARRAFYAIAALSLFGSALGIVAVRFPKLQPFLEPLIGPIEEPVSGDPTMADISVGRQMQYVGFGHELVQVLASRFSPLSLLNPVRLFRFVLFTAALTLIMLSGFRSALIGVMGTFLIAGYFRDGMAKILRLGIVCLVGVVMVILMQGTVINLPRSVQRTLSFLPGRWDQVAVADATVSSEWRFDMWRRMLGTDRYIDSKWLGDGFGMTAVQLQQINVANAMMDTEQEKESYLIIGQVHSGPVSTIRFVGYVGLFFFLCLLAALAREAFLLCRMAMGTPYDSLTLYLCIPVLYHPFEFIFIFGSYDYDLPRALLAAGMLKMLRTSLQENVVPATEDVADLPLQPLDAGRPDRPLPAHLLH